MVETTKYVEVTKNIPTTNKQSCHMCETSATTKPKVGAQLVNKRRALNQEMKTIIEGVTEPPTPPPPPPPPHTHTHPKTETPELQQTKRDRQSQTGRVHRPSLLR